MPGYGLLTKGGTVIDGVRLPRHRADSRVAGATISSDSACRRGPDGGRAVENGPSPHVQLT